MDQHHPIGCHDRQADRYDAHVQELRGDYVRENYDGVLYRVIRRAELAPGQAVLDIGIGTGLLTQRLPMDIDSYGIDISGKMMAKIRSKSLGVRLSFGNFLGIPFQRAVFDRVVSTFAFHHLDQGEKERSYREMDRVLQPGGAIVIGDFMTENDGQRRDLIRKFESEGRTDMVEELEDEFFLDLAHDVPLLERLGYHAEYERLSTLSWVLTCAKGQNGAAAP